MNKEEIINFPEKYAVIGADLSMNRPGFSLFTIKNSENQAEIINIQVFSVDNKKSSSKKTRGCILTEINECFDSIYQSITDVNKIFLVREKSINNSFFGKRSGTSARTAVSEVVGVMDFSAWKYGSEWHEIYPVTIKKEITGSGKAEKNQVAEALERYIGKIEYKNDDESDAAAVAVAWLIQNKQIKLPS